MSGRYWLAMRHDLSIAGPAFRLRPVVDADADFILALRGNPALNRFLHSTSARLSDQLDWLARRLQHPAQYLAQHRERLRNLQRQLGAGLLQASARAHGELTRLSRRLLLKRPHPARHAGRLA